MDTAAGKLLAVSSCLLVVLASSPLGCRPGPAGPDDRIVGLMALPEGGAVVLSPTAAYLFDAHSGLTTLPQRDPRVRSAQAEAAARPRAALHGDCYLSPNPQGLFRLCPDGTSIVDLSGFPALAAAAYQGGLFAGTYGGGLRRVNAPEGPVPGSPSVVTALAVASGLLLCGSEHGLYVYDGARLAFYPILTRSRSKDPAPAGKNHASL